MTQPPAPAASGPNSPQPDLPTTTDTATPAVEVPFPRGVRSFVMRTGRVTIGQAKAMETLGPRFIIPFSEQLGDIVSELRAHARDAQGQPFARVVMEIGFGMGDATAQIAQAMPDTLFLCCEVHEPGVGALLKQVGERGLDNIRIFQHDAVQVLAHMVPHGALDGFHIFFPDPWHKKRHNKRRLIQPAFTTMLAERLRPGGYLHCATDWEPYAEQMREVLGAEPLLTNTSTHAQGWAERPAYRPLTKFENRGLRLGHGVWDLVYQRR